MTPFEARSPGRLLVGHLIKTCNPTLCPLHDSFHTGPDLPLLEQSLSPETPEKVLHSEETQTDCSRTHFPFLNRVSPLSLILSSNPI